MAQRDEPVPETFERRLKALEAASRRLRNPFDDPAVQLALEAEASVSARTRYVWLHPDDFLSLTGAPTLAATAGGWAVATSAWLLDGGGAVEGVTGKVALPADWVSDTVIFNIFYQGTGANTDNRRMNLDAAAITPGTDSIEKAADITEARTISHGNGICTKATFTVELAVDSGDIIRAAFSRVSNHADDTNTDDMAFLGMRLDYTAFF